MQHWALTTKYSIREAQFFIAETRMLKLKRALGQWQVMVLRRIRLTKIIINHRRRVAARLVWAWRNLLERQDRLLNNFAMRAEMYNRMLIADTISEWRVFHRRCTLNGLVCKRSVRKLIHATIWVWHIGVMKIYRCRNMLNYAQQVGTYFFSFHTSRSTKGLARGTLN